MSTNARTFIQSGSRWEELAGYSRAVVDGDWVFVSGTIGQDFASGNIPASAEQQCGRALPLGSGKELPNGIADENSLRCTG